MDERVEVSLAAMHLIVQVTVAVVIEVLTDDLFIFSMNGRSCGHDVLLPTIINHSPSWHTYLELRTDKDVVSVLPDSFLCGSASTMSGSTQVVRAFPGHFRNYFCRHQSISRVPFSPDTINAHLPFRVWPASKNALDRILFT